MSYFDNSNLGYRNQKAPDGRLRTAGQISLGDYKQFHDNAGGFFNTETIGTGSITYEGDAIGATALETAASGDAVIRQTYQWHNYFAGKPQKIELTASKFNIQAGVTKKFGYFSSTTTTPFATSLDGLFFECNPAGIYCRIYRAGTLIYSAEKADWLNQSELTNYDPADFNFYVIDFLYLGGAIANFWVLTSKGLTLVASYQHINVDQNTFIKSPNQPVRYEITQAALGTGLFNHICSDVASEGQISNVGAVRNYDTNSTGLSGMATGTRYALLGVRHAANAMNIVIDFLQSSVLSDSNDDFLVEFIFGGATIGTPTWAAIPFTQMEGFKGAGIAGAIGQKVHSGGVPLISFYIAQSGSFTARVDTSRKLGSYINGVSEEAFLCVTPLSSNGAAYGSIIWREF